MRFSYILMGISLLSVLTIVINGVKSLVLKRRKKIKKRILYESLGASGKASGKSDAVFK